MAVKVYDRDEWLKMRPQRRAAETRARRQQIHTEVEAQFRRAERPRRIWELITTIPRVLWELTFGLAMYSNDPTIARDAIVYNASRAHRADRALQIQQHQEDLAAREQERRQAQADEERRMRILAREMAKEMVAEVNRQRTG